MDQVLLPCGVALANTVGNHSVGGSNGHLYPVPMTRRVNRGPGIQESVDK